jgi:hypothetical protein
MRHTRIQLLLLSAGLQACVHTPSDDPADWTVDSTVTYTANFDPVRWVVPSDALPADAAPMLSNNNVDIEFFKGRMYLAWRTAPTHFASAETLMHVISSADLGESWRAETTVALGSDIREPRLLHIHGELQLLFFQGGTNPMAFEPQKIWATSLEGNQQWSAPVVVNEEPVVPWDIKLRDGALWMTSYAGEHYTGGENPTIELYFSRSLDGRQWEPVGTEPTVYTGGVSEAAFEFDAAGDLWAVTRNEDGDASGFGAHLCTAPSDQLGQWDCPEQSDPERYDSPEMFRHGDDLYLVARRDIGGPYGPAGNIVAYSFRPKRTALYQIHTDERRIEHLFDFPSAGDTAFPAIRRYSAHEFYLANYTSPIDDPDITWIEGQTSDRGTQIYLTRLFFTPN